MCTEKPSTVGENLGGANIIYYPPKKYEIHSRCVNMLIEQSPHMFNTDNKIKINIE